MLQWTVSVDPLTESNCYILTEGNRCVIIDPGESENLLALLEEKEWEPDLLLLTHEHCDHMAGLDPVRDRFPRARFAATRLCDEGIRSTRLNMSGIMEVYLYFRGKPGIHYDPFVCRPADEIIPDTAQLHWRGHTLRLVPMPGHTPGSSGIFLDERVKNNADALFSTPVPVPRGVPGTCDPSEKSPPRISPQGAALRAAFSERVKNNADALFFTPVPVPRAAQTLPDPSENTPSRISPKGRSASGMSETVFFSGDYLIPGEEPLLRFPGGDAEAFARVTEPFLRTLPGGIRICPGHGESFIL